MNTKRVYVNKIVRLRFSSTKIKGIFVLMCALAVLWGVWQAGLLDKGSPEALKECIDGSGPWAPLLYVVLFTVVPLTLFPDGVLAMAGGMAFGMIQGAFLTWLGALCGGSLAFWIARLWGRTALEKLLSKLGQKTHETPPMTGFLSILVLRLVPLVPFDVISYGAGLSQVRYRDFIGATAVGIIPGVLVYVNLGNKLFKWSDPSFICAVLMLITLCVISSMGVRYLKKKQKYGMMPETIAEEKSEVS